jgi:glycosyltransferase involved in cell wall biosynthesis
MLVGPMPPTKGGVTTFMLNLMASPLRNTFDFVPFTTSRPPKTNVTENWGYRAMLRGGVARMFSGAAITLWHLCSFPVAVLGSDVDLVQIQACDYQVFWESAFYAVMARLLGRPVLFRIGGAFDIFHGQASRFEQRLIAAVLRLPNVVIAQSAFARDHIRQAGRTGDIVLLPNWSGMTPAPNAMRAPRAAPVCLFMAGQEARRKGVEDVLAAAALLKQRGATVHIHMLAVPPSLQARIAATDLADMMTLEGPAPHDRVLTLMRQCDLFLLPSHGEGFPNALVEAMAAGMACLATPVGAVPEMAEGGGVVTVPVGKPHELADAINILVESAELRCRMGTLALETVRTRYTENAALPALAQAYTRLLSPKRALPVVSAAES